MAKKRGNNEGTIVKRKDGLWMAQVSIGRDAGGKLKRATFYGKTRQAVAEKLAEAQHDLSRGVFVEPHQRTLGEWLQMWLVEYKRPRACRQ
jgi:integrase